VDSTLLEAPGEAAGTALILAVAGFAVVVIIDLVSKSVGGPSHDEEVSELTS
jgi:hypothetical protein